MKTIRPRIKLPEWAQWIAQDVDGMCFVFDRKPVLYNDASYWCINSGKGRLCYKTEPSQNWRNSLRKI